MLVFGQKGEEDVDYSQAASELIDRMFCFFHTPEQRKLSDFPKGETFILNYLTDREGPVLPSELSGAMQASTARVAAALNSLEAKGEIIRQTDSADRRRTLVTLTPLGREKVLQRRRAVHRYIQEMLRSLGEEDTTEFLRLLDRLRQIREEELPPPLV